MDITDFDSFYLSTGRKGYKIKKRISKIAHFGDLLSINSELFYHTIEEEIGIPHGTCESILQTNGSMGICKDEDGTIVVGISNMASTSFYNYQKGDSVKITMYRSNKVFDCKLFEDCIVIFNNTARQPVLDLELYSNFLTEIDISLDRLIYKSRAIDIPIARDDNELKQIAEAIQALEDGNYKVVQSKLNLKDIMDQGHMYIDKISLSDVSTSDKIQYLTLLRNALKEQFYTKYGHCLKNTAKLAQQTKDEVDDLNVTSMILPYNMLKCRQEGWQHVNALFGTNFTCSFGPLVQFELDKMKEDEEVEDEEVEDEEVEDKEDDVNELDS